MLIRIHGSELMRFHQENFPWWDRGVRGTMHEVVPGQPAAEEGLDEEPTGWYLMSGVTDWDVWFLEVVRASWRKLDAMEDQDEAGAISYVLLTKDWEAFRSLEGPILAHALPVKDAKQRAIDYVKASIVSSGLEGVPTPPDEIVYEEVEEVIE